MDYIKLDLSFIPTYDFPDDLLEFEGETVIMPYTESKLKYNLDDLSVAKKQIECVERFYNFEFAMVKFAKERQDLGDLSLAEKCFRYLIELGCIQPQVFDSLIDIYYIQNDKFSIHWLSEKLEKAIELRFNDDRQKQDLITLLGKVS